MQPTESKPRNFNNPEVVTQSWYFAAPSRKIRRGQVKSFDLLNRRIALYRDDAGRVHAIDARCAHFGTDLGLGEVIGDQIRCPFHNWSYGPDGRCLHAPGLARAPRARLRTYPTEERWGLIWIFNGPQAAFALPGPPIEANCGHLNLFQAHINCNPHLAIANGMDVPHFDATHRFTFSSEPKLEVDPPYRVTLTSQGRPRSPLRRALTRSRQQDICSRVTTVGSSLAWVEFISPIRFFVLLAARPSAQGGCDSRVIFLFPKGMRWRRLQAMIMMGVLLSDDVEILNTIVFKPAFTESDSALKAFSETVNGLPTW